MLDRKIPFVNDSDNIARYLFRNFPHNIAQDLKVRDHQKYLSLK